MAQHQSQCSIFANQRLSNIFFCFVVFGLSADRLRSVAYQRSSTLLQIAFTEQSFQPFPDGGGWKIEVADDWQRPIWGGSSSRGTGEPCLGDTGELSLRAYGGFAAENRASAARSGAFSKRCNLPVMVLGDPANTVLQPSIRDVMKACMPFQLATRPLPSLCLSSVLSVMCSYILLSIVICHKI